MNYGGPLECSDLKDWRHGLVMDNHTWTVVDRGDPHSKDVIGVWDLIQNESAFGPEVFIHNLKKIPDALKAVYKDKFVSFPYSAVLCSKAVIKYLKCVLGCNISSVLELFQTFCGCSVTLSELEYPMHIYVVTV